MNPLDKEELKAFLKIIKKDMPIHTDDTVKIKCSYSQDMPKNLMDYSQKIDNEFLNDNLHTIEEMEFRKKGITNNFKNYQNKYYDKSGILNHDLYFEHENKIYAKISGACGFIINPYNFAPIAPPAPDLSTNYTDTTFAGVDHLIMTGCKFSAGVIGDKYNRIKSRLSTAAGNYKMGVYQQTSNVPSTLYNGTGSLTAVNDNWESLTELTLVQTTVWGAQKFSSDSLVTYYVNGTGNRVYKAHDYATAFPDPFGSGTADAYPNQMKLGHS